MFVLKKIILQILLCSLRSTCPVCWKQSLAIHSDLEKYNLFPKNNKCKVYLNDIPNVQFDLLLIIAD